MVQMMLSHGASSAVKRLVCRSAMILGRKSRKPWCCQLHKNQGKTSTSLVILSVLPVVSQLRAYISRAAIAVLIISILPMKRIRYAPPVKDFRIGLMGKKVDTAKERLDLIEAKGQEALAVQGL